MLIEEHFWRKIWYVCSWFWMSSWRLCCCIFDWRTFSEEKSGDIVLDGERISWRKNLMLLFLMWNEVLEDNFSGAVLFAVVSLKKIYLLPWFCWSLWWRWSSKRILEEDMNSVVERKFGENSWRRPKDDASLNEVRGRKPCCILDWRSSLRENLLHTIFWFLISWRLKLRYSLNDFFNGDWFAENELAWMWWRDGSEIWNSAEVIDRKWRTLQLIGELRFAGIC